MDRGTLIDACALEDYTTVRECGWFPIYEALRDWWAKFFPLRELTPYADVLGSEDPEQVMEALRTLRAEEWRPKPSGLYRAFSSRVASPPASSNNIKDRFGQTLRPDQRSGTLARVRWLLAEARDEVCECVPRPTHIVPDEFNVLHCRECKGIEQGQVFQAEDEVDF